MAMTPEKIEGQSDRASSPRIQFPWVLALGVLVGIVAVAYSFDSDRSLSERTGILSGTDADNDVIPSLSPNN
jgi:hypothetical protein